MLVRFKNAEVPVCKLRQGTVVCYEGSTDAPRLMHIKCFYSRSIIGKEDFLIVAEDKLGCSEYLPEWLTWLET